VATASQHCPAIYNSFYRTFWAINNALLYSLQLAAYDFHLLKTKNITESISLNVYTHTHIYIYIYIYTHTYTHTHMQCHDDQ